MKKEIKNTYKKFARIPIIPGEVREIFKGEELFAMTEELAKTWREIPSDSAIEEFWIFDGKKFSAPIKVDPIIIAKVDPMLERITNNNAELLIHIGDIKNGMLAIKGFMMEIPNIRNQLDQIIGRTNQINEHRSLVNSGISYVGDPSVPSNINKYISGE